ncbi:MAG: L-threonylcarbamoyladenylate synthase [Microthrixaceae bacterium]
MAPPPPPGAVVPVDPVHPAHDVLAAASGVLRAGGLVAFPTETVYGLGALISDRPALARIFRVKGRPATDPLIVHAADAADAAGVAGAWPSTAAALAERFWPGPLTLVLPRGPGVPDEVTAGGPTVGVRVPAHPVARALVAAAGTPVAAPSANRFGRISPTTAAHVVAELGDGVDLVLDAGPAPLGIESTVLDLTLAVPTVLRPGAVTVEDLAEAIGEVHAPRREVVATDDVAAAPGRFLRHYAPATPVVLVEGGRDLALRLESAVAAAGPTVCVVRLPEDPALAAAELYGALRAADDAGAALILATAVPAEGVGRAVNDRLFRAAHGRVVDDDSAAAVRRLVALAAA